MNTSIWDLRQWIEQATPVWVIAVVGIAALVVLLCLIPRRCTFSLGCDRCVLVRGHLGVHFCGGSFVRNDHWIGVDLAKGKDVSVRLKLDEKGRTVWEDERDKRNYDGK